MNISELNTCDNGSTGRIMLGVSDILRKHGNNVSSFSLRPKTDIMPPEFHEYFSSFTEYAAHYCLSLITGRGGMYSESGTAALLKRFDELGIEALHLHNLHNCYVNLPMLFEWIKKKNVRVVWTLHDCWAFTGKCPYFDCAGCDKWRTGCSDCPQLKSYPKSFIDKTAYMYGKKKEWFTGVENMTLVTPSSWLAGLAGQSFLKDYRTAVINNGIDLGIFKPQKSDFRAKYGLQNKKIILGVALKWDMRKNPDVLIKAATELGDEYAVVMVGTDEELEKRLPANIVAIRRTENTSELADIYSAADVFANPTLEDNFPTVNLEALACGTPVVTYDSGGSAESIDKSCGISVKRGNADEFIGWLKKVCDEKPLSSEACIARASNYDAHTLFEEYTMLFD